MVNILKDKIYLDEKELLEFMEYGLKRSEQKLKKYKGKVKTYDVMIRGYHSGILTGKDIKKTLAFEQELYLDILKDLRLFKLINLK